MTKESEENFNKEIARYEEMKKSAKNEDELYHINFMIWVLKSSMKYASDDKKNE